MDNVINSLTDLGSLYFWLFFVPIILPWFLYTLWRKFRFASGELPDLPIALFGLGAALFLPAALGAFCGGLMDVILETDGLNVVVLLVGLAVGGILSVRFRS